MAKYPKDFIDGDYDETFDEAKATFSEIKDALIKLRARFSGGDEEAALDKTVDKIWSDDCKSKSGKKNVKSFITSIVRKADHTLKVSDAAFSEILEAIGVVDNMV